MNKGVSSVIAAVILASVIAVSGLAAVKLSTTGLLTAGKMKQQTLPMEVFANTNLKLWLENDTLKAKLILDNETPVSGETVYFSFDQSKYSATTDKSGVASVKIGNYSGAIVASYPGNGKKYLNGVEENFYVHNNLDEKVSNSLKKALEKYQPENVLDPKHTDLTAFVSFKVLSTNFMSEMHSVDPNMTLSKIQNVYHKYYFNSLTKLNDYRKWQFVYFDRSLTSGDSKLKEILKNTPFLGLDERVTTAKEYSYYNEIIIRPLYCKEVPVPDGMYDWIINNMSSKGSYDLIHAFIGIMNLRDGGCVNKTRANVDLRRLSYKVVDEINNINPEDKIDLYLEYVDVLLISGNGDLVKPEWIEKIIELQNPDGGWPLRMKGSPSHPHSTYVGLEVLLAYKKYIIDKKPYDFSYAKDWDLKNMLKLPPSQETNKPLRYIIKYKKLPNTNYTNKLSITGFATMEPLEINKRIKLFALESRKKITKKYLGVIELKPSEKNELENLINQYSDEIESIIPDRKIKVLDNYTSTIRLKGALNEFNLTGKGIKICILDTGVNKSVVPYSVGYDFVNNDNDPS
ncbi:MAG: hypothetical protein J7L43_00525, partial [Candidatus Aenigmarchaeota archaeon]|nr:hypothetical protein [Candidatus Aenigmarchaeota archaeon]